MGKRKNRSYSEEFRTEAVNLVLKQGLTQTKVAQDLGVSQSLLSKWVKKAKEAENPGALATSERLELKRLRRENQILKQERDILKKAAAFFAKEM